jgi:Fe-S-cluster containining protein
MKLDSLFRNYELVVDKAEEAFQSVTDTHGECIRCHLHCSDCCHAVFGLFLIEAAYIHEHFTHLEEAVKEEVMARADKADRDLETLQNMLREFENDPKMTTYTMARERIRCPLLDEKDECVLYHRRPVTCRVYGIPTKIQGKSRVCGKAAFQKGVSYPVYDLDGAYRDLFFLSRELLILAEDENQEKASLLVTVSNALRRPVEDLIRESLEGPGEAPQRDGKDSS